jgi:hypothetical protein
MNEGAYAVWYVCIVLLLGDEHANGLCRALAAVMEAGYGSETAANIWIVKTG